MPKAKIAANGDYNLSGERYREGASNAGLKWPLVPIGELCVVERGASPRPIHDFMTDAPDGVNWIKIGDAEVGAKYITSTKERVTPEGAAKSRRVKPGDFILSNSMSFGRPYIMAIDGCIHDGWLLLRDQSDRLDQDFLYNILGSKPVLAQFERSATGGVVNNLNSEIVRGVQIPLPPLEVQKEIVAEIEGYQKVINGARSVLDHYRPHIPIHPDWPIVELGEVLTLQRGYDLPKQDWKEGDYPIVGSNGIIGFHNAYKEVGPGVVTGRSGTIGKVHYIAATHYWPHNTSLFVKDFKGNDPKFVLHLLESVDLKSLGERTAAVPSLDRKNAHRLKVSLPPPAAQQAIVAEIEAEQALVAANRELMARFEQKIQATLARVWGEEEPAAPEA